MGVEHLWKWDGKRPELLEEAITHWATAAVAIAFGLEGG